MKFDFEHLVVYQKALDFVEHVFAVCDRLPSKYQSSLGDQLRRASLSVTNNLAEGSGQSSKKKKYCFYEISLNSFRERVPVLTILERRNLVETQEIELFRERSFEICKMIRGLMRVLK